MEEGGARVRTRKKEREREREKIKKTRKLKRAGYTQPTKIDRARRLRELADTNAIRVRQLECF